MQFKQKLAYIALGGLLVFMGQLLSIISNNAKAQDEKVSAEFDEIKCRSLKIVDKEGKVYAELEKREGEVETTVIKVFNDKGKVVGQLGSDTKGGVMSISHSDGTERILIKAVGTRKSKGGLISVYGGSDGSVSLITGAGGDNVILVKGARGTCSISDGSVLVKGDADKGSAAMLIGKNGARVAVMGGEQSGAVDIAINEHGGRMNIWGKGTDTTQASMRVNEYGSGAIGLWDKNGNRIEPAGALPKTSEGSTTPTCAYCERYNELIGNYPLCTGPGAECDQQSPCGCFRGCQ